MAYTYSYPRPAVTVDCVVFGIWQAKLYVVLIQRDRPPFEGHWALPGGFVEIDEPLEKAAYRELAEETGIHQIRLEQLHTFGQPGRDPRGRVISVVYWGLEWPVDLQLQPGDDARHAAWFPWHQMPPLAFDHAEILQVAYHRLVQKARWGPIGREVLPARFSLRQLLDVYEAIFQRKLNRQRFRRRMLRLGLIRPVGWDPQATPRTYLYRFQPRVYNRLSQQGFVGPFWT